MSVNIFVGVLQVRAAVEKRGGGDQSSRVGRKQHPKRRRVSPLTADAPPQISTSIQKLELDWPEEIRNFFAMLNLLSLSFSALSPRCILSKWSYLDKVPYVNAAPPVVFAFLMAHRYSAPRLQYCAAVAWEWAMDSSCLTGLRRGSQVTCLADPARSLPVPCLASASSHTNGDTPPPPSRTSPPSSSSRQATGCHVLTRRCPPPSPSERGNAFGVGSSPPSARSFSRPSVGIRGTAPCARADGECTLAGPTGEIAARLWERPGDRAGRIERFSLLRSLLPTDPVEALQGPLPPSAHAQEPEQRGLPPAPFPRLLLSPASPPSLSHRHPLLPRSDGPSRQASDGCPLLQMTSPEDTEIRSLSECALDVSPAMLLVLSWMYAVLANTNMVNPPLPSSSPH